ncbi:lasso peptide biosynthesis B2 protein [Psychrobacillus sp. INOP01]|uniref:lasso peptide biosynthesis B2 protein n=1 Tax=Psychrobacillus sp. INOP01 TaxID=2829187 RepID=UPI001BABE892|nr:lasso peptide biosynthesis B2 protein [Psychrobacillus sp. INOP01]QUG43127.1 lasso peptide biosynthesis B2 protein [Psychrobacillus sp. INOP01]
MTHETYLNVSQMVDFIDRVCILYPKKAECLHRSFLGYKYLRTEFKLPVDLVIGVRKYPFSAHAWLTMFEENINDSNELTNQYSVILKSKEKSYEIV